MPTLNIDKDVIINYQVQGQGETIVLIHGLGANLAFWYLGIGKLLATRYRVISYDLRGHGRSSMPGSGYTLPDMARDLGALLDHLGADKVHIVGHSYGARVAVMFAILSPAQVKTLTIADTQISCLQDKIRLRDWPHWETWKSQLQVQGFEKFPPTDEYIDYQLLVHFNQIHNQLTHGALNRKQLAPSLKRRDMGKRGALRWDRLMRTTSAKQAFGEDHQITVEQIQQLQVPTLVVFGEYSHCLESCRKLYTYISDCRVKVLPEVGHFLPAMKPRLFVRTLLGFLAAGDRSRGIRRAATRQRQLVERRALAADIKYPVRESRGNVVLFDRRKSDRQPMLVQLQTQTQMKMLPQSIPSDTEQDDLKAESS
jgi:pimeloyl-ACP methyl ester carboxylesterase